MVKRLVKLERDSGNKHCYWMESHHYQYMKRRIRQQVLPKRWVVGKGEKDNREIMHIITIIKKRFLHYKDTN